MTSWSWPALLVVCEYIRIARGGRLVSDFPELRFDVPNSARIWNYWLGGKDNYAADREIADAVLVEYPQIRLISRLMRQFLARAVRFVAGEAGVDQFLDIGAGLPTMENTHQVAQRTNPACHVVYVDHDPMVLAHARVLMADATPEGATTYLYADVRDPAALIDKARGHVDFDRPIAVLLFALLGNATPDVEDMRSVVRTLTAAVPSGSYLVVADAIATDGRRPGSSVIGYTLRSMGQIAGCFDGLELVEPGVVSVPKWRPDCVASSVLENIPAAGGVARKP
ncbi:SAM-dependent methyltransferase [Actinomycetes bacterium KLBMP 9759]